MADARAIYATSSDAAETTTSAELEERHAKSSCRYLYLGFEELGRAEIRVRVRVRLGIQSLWFQPLHTYIHMYVCMYVIQINIISILNNLMFHCK